METISEAELNILEAAGLGDLLEKDGEWLVSYEEIEMKSRDVIAELVTLLRTFIAEYREPELTSGEKAARRALCDYLADRGLQHPGPPTNAAAKLLSIAEHALRVGGPIYIDT